ncbi:MAG: hypothetical protein HY909_12725 [Deltaproteobacteria bacterium]|nr:hypothetical protein [Deltaproteobacteria bacterium]
MPENLFTAAVVATALALVLEGGVLLGASSGKRERRFLVVTAALTLPMCAVALYGVRLPFLDHVWRALAALLNPDVPPALLPRTTAYRVLKIFEAPLAEDLARLWPLFLPWWRRGLAEHHRVRVAAALGLGFGVGELWTVAWLLRKNPGLVGLPWHALGGFIAERVMVCVMHGAFTAVALRRWGRGFRWGVLGGMGLHLLGNLPILLASLNVPPLGRDAWRALLGLWVLGYFFAMGALLLHLHGEERRR